MTYSVYQRGGKGNFICTYINPRTGKRTNRSTGVSIRRQAELVAKEIYSMAANQQARGDLAPYIQEYMNHLENSNYSKGHLYNTQLGISTFNFKTVEEMLAPQAVQNAMDKMREGRMLGTLNGYLRKMKAFMNWMYDQGYLLERPTFKLFKLKDKDKRRRGAFTTQERDLLLTKPTGTVHGMPAQLRIFAYAMGFYAGLRKSEMCRLKITDIDFDNKVLFLREQKNGSFTKQPINDRLMEIIKATPTQPDGSYFHIDSPHILEALYKDMAKLGIEKYNQAGEQRDLHAIRNSFISHLFEKGADIKSVQTLARHADPGMTLELYARTTNDQLKNAADLL